MCRNRCAEVGGGCTAGQGWGWIQPDPKPPSPWTLAKSGKPGQTAPCSANPPAVLLPDVAAKEGAATPCPAEGSQRGGGGRAGKSYCFGQEIPAASSPSPGSPGMAEPLRALEIREAAGNVHLSWDGQGRKLIPGDWSVAGGCCRK